MSDITIAPEIVREILLCLPSDPLSQTDIITLNNCALVCHQCMAISREILLDRLCIIVDTQTSNWSKAQAFLDLLEKPQSSFRLPTSSLNLKVFFAESFSNDREAADRRRRVRGVLSHARPRVHQLEYRSRANYLRVKDGLEDIRVLGVHLVHVRTLHIVVRSQAEANLWMGQIASYALNLETLQMAGLPSPADSGDTCRELPTQNAPSSLKRLDFQPDVSSGVTELLEWLWRSRVLVQQVSFNPGLSIHSIARAADALQHPAVSQLRTLRFENPCGGNISHLGQLIHLRALAVRSPQGLPPLSQAAGVRSTLQTRLLCASLDSLLVEPQRIGNLALSILCDNPTYGVSDSHHHSQALTILDQCLTKLMVGITPGIIINIVAKADASSATDSISVDAWMLEWFPNLRGVTSSTTMSVKWMHTDSTVRWARWHLNKN